jgi:hypothetical protein
MAPVGRVRSLNIRSRLLALFVFFKDFFNGENRSAFLFLVLKYVSVNKPVGFGCVMRTSVFRSERC